MSKDNICYGCMQPKKLAMDKCPRCGYMEGTEQPLPALATGTVLAKRYVVGRKLSSNGEGLSYIGLDEESGKRVTIREYLPQTLCRRSKGSDALSVKQGASNIYDDYMSDFIEVSRAVSRLSSEPAAICARDLFECNNTAYAIYDYTPSRPLSELIKRADRLSWDECRELFLPVIDTMAAAHSLGLVHFGLSPETIRMNKDGKLIITGFGIPDARIMETDLHPELYDGYSAIEQYSADAKKGKWTDVYSLCAVILFCLTGKRPPDAKARSFEPKLSVSSELAASIPTHVIAALASGLQVYGDNRTRSMEQLKSELAQKLVASPQQRAATAYAAEKNSAYNPQSRKSSTEHRSAPPSGKQHPAAGHSTPPQGSKASIMHGINKVAVSAKGAGSTNAAKDGDQKPEPWYRNLTQFQYGLLAAIATILVLGVIALVVFIGVKDKIAGDAQTGANVIDLGDVDGSGGGAINEANLEVPDFVGKVYSSLKINPDYLAFTFVVLDEEYSNTYEEGVVIRQSVTKGSMVPEGSVIALTVSLGSENVQIPELAGYTIAMADSLLSGSGLLLGEQTEEYSDSVGAGKVIAINGAEAGAWVKRNTRINVIVSLGAE